MKGSDIASLLDSIKSGIQRVEGGDHSDALLMQIREEFLDVLELLKLFLISERDSYYGYFVMNLQFEVDFYNSFLAGIKLDTFPPVFSSNPLLLCKFNLKEILYIFCHEIDHIVLNHPAEMLKANPQNDPEVFEQFNLAADASVNDRVNHEKEQFHLDFLAEPKGLITSEVLKELLGLAHIRPLESYAYYYQLIKEQEQKHIKGEHAQPQRMMSTLGGRDEGKSSGKGTDTKPGGASDLAQEQQSDGQSPVTSNNYQKLQDHQWRAGQDADEAAAHVREFVNSAVSMMNDESRGLMPGSFMSQVALLNAPPVISWQSMLKKYVGTISASKLKTRMRLNRRQPLRFDISGTTTEKVLKIIVAIDTSGSVNDRQIVKIFTEILAILATRKHEITVIECDAQVQRVYKLKTGKDVQRKVQGRGGTLFTPVIEHINKDKYFRDALLIYFTDGFGEYTIPRPRTYRNLWVVLRNKENLSLREPYGASVTL